MATITVPGMFLTGNHAGRPSSGVGKGTLYSCTTHGLVYQTTDTGATWVTWATLGASPSGSITASGYTQSTARLLGRNTASTGAIEEITLGTNLSFTGTTLNASGGGGAPTSSEARLTGDVTMVSSGTWYDGPSLSLAAGKWLVLGKLLLQCNNASATALLGRLYDGTNTYDVTEYDYGGSNSGEANSKALMAVITLGGTTTVKIQGQDVARTGSKMLAAGSAALGNLATVITATEVS